MTADRMTTGSAEALAAALAALELPGRVEARGRLAVFVPASPQPRLAEPALRQRLVTLAAAHGFSHLALELDGED